MNRKKRGFIFWFSLIVLFGLVNSQLLIFPLVVRILLLMMTGFVYAFLVDSLLKKYNQRRN